MLNLSTLCTSEYQCSVPQNTHHNIKFCKKIHFPISKMYVTSVSYIMSRLYYIGNSQIHLVFSQNQYTQQERLSLKLFFHKNTVISGILLLIKKKDIFIVSSYSICSDLHICFHSRNEQQIFQLEVEGRQQTLWKIFQS